MVKTFLLAIVTIVGAIGLFFLMNNSSDPSNTLTVSLTPEPTSQITPPPTQEPEPTNSTSTPSVTQTSVTPTKSAQNTVENPTQATIKTSKGDIVISFYNEDAPKTIANFVNKSESGFYNNLTFHRVEDWVIQGGDPLGNGTGGGNMPVEFNKKPFVTGAVGIASRGDGKVQNDAQFFVVKKDSQFLNQQYTNFGIVTKGMDVVNKITIGDKILSISIE